MEIMPTTQQAPFPAKGLGALIGSVISTALRS